MNKLNLVLIALIIIFYLFTRIFQISLVPGSLYWDEASIGYNAYSILKTGKDEWGQFLPLHFKAFGEYKLPVYIYSVSLSEFILGLNIEAVRIPSVLFGLGIVCLTYLLGLRLYNNKVIAILGAFLLTISNWFFIFSRTGFEAVAGLFWFLLMLYFWLKSKERKIFLILSSLFFVLSIYSYNSYRVISILFLVVIFIDIFRKKEFLKYKLLILIFSLIVMISLIPILSLYVTHKADNRLNSVGIFNSNEKNSKIAFNFFRNYLTHFNPSFLLKGDINFRNQQPGFGQLYIIDLFFLIISLGFILKHKKLNQFLPSALILLSFIPSALTKESPHALRALSAVPFISLMVAHGIFVSSKLLHKTSFYVVIISVYFILFGYYLYNFLNIYQTLAYDYWQYEYKIIYDNYALKFQEFDNVIISDRYYQPYIFTLFYLKVDPQKFRDKVKYNQSIRKETSLVYNFDKFIYNNIDFYNFPKGKDLIFAHPSERLSEIPYNDVMLNPDGSVAFYVYSYVKK